jgi:hypothetical protein
MRAGLAFWAGVLGAVVMVLGMWIAYGAGATGFSFGWWWGSMVLGTTGGGSWILGFVIHLFVGGLIGLIYAAAFEAIGRSNWGWGLLGGFIQLVISGFVLGWISDVHPAIPAVIANPGFFTAHWGWASILTFCLVTLAFGMIIGGLYEPIHQTLRPPARRGAAEEFPVGVGQERHGREETYATPNPEDKTSSERSPAKTGNKR